VVVPAVAVAAVVVVAAVNPPSAFRASVLLMPSEKLGWHLFWCPLDRQMELANDLPVYYYRASMKFPSLKTLLFIGLYAAVGAAGYWLGNSRAASSAPTPAKSRAPAGAAANTHGRLPGTVTLDRGDVDKFLQAKGKPDAAALAEWAKNLSPDECAAYLASIQKMPPGQQRDAVLNAIIGSWAAQDPKGFLADAKDISGPRMKEQGTDAALKAWAAQNPTDALQWIKDNPGSAPTAAVQARYLAAFAGYATTDPQGAFAAANALSGTTLMDQRLKNQAIQAVMSGFADQGKFTDATALIAQMPDGAQKNQALASIASSWGSANPADATAWVASMTDPQQRSSLGGQIAAQWAATDPAAAANWAAQMDSQAAADAQNNGAATPSSYMLADAMRTWASYDLDATGDFLNQLPASPDKDGAVATFALTAAQDDPASAMNWVNTIGDPGMQQRLAMVTALQWQQSDPAGYSTFISNTTLLSDQQKQMLATLQPMIANAQAGGRGGFGGGFGGGGGNGGGANPGGIPARMQDMVINGGGAAGAFLSGGGFGGLLAPAPAAASGSAMAPANTGRAAAPNIITSLRQGRRNGGTGANGG